MNRRQGRPGALHTRAAAGSGSAVDDGASMGALGLAGMKAGIVGAAGMAILMLINLVSLPLLPCLVAPGSVVMLIVTGLLAGLLAGDRLKTPTQATRAGVAAGFVAGMGAGFTAVLLAALGLMFTQLGEGLRDQLSPVQLRNLAGMGIGADTVQTAGAVFLAFFIWGVGGTIIAVLLGALGSRLYFRWR